MCVFARRVENLLDVAIDCPEGRDAGELDRAPTFGRARYQLRRCEDNRRGAFG
jgi:hypothetical protein